MKIETEIIRKLDGAFAWADEHIGRGFLAHSKGADVPDSWLEKHGLIEPEAPAKSEPETPAELKTPAAKKAAAPANKQVKGPANDK